MAESHVVPRFSLMQGKAFTPGRADMFLEAIATGSEDQAACDFAGITLHGFRERRRTDPKFKAAYQVARAARIEVYRAEARRRAIEGVAEPVFYRGEQVGYVRKFSDRMLEVLLRAEDPDSFGDRKVIEVSVQPMTGADINRALELGKRGADAVAALEAVAALFADAEVLEAVASADGDGSSFEVE